MKLEKHFYPKDVFFINDETGWIVGSQKDRTKNITSIFSTRDGGWTWRGTHLKTNYPPELIKFIDEKEGILITGTFHDDIAAHSEILKTSDAGIHWKPFYMVNEKVNDLVESGDSLLAVCNNGSMLKGTREGAWSKIETAVKDDLTTLSSFKGSILVASTGREFIFSNDNGEEWEVLTVPAKFAGTVSMRFLHDNLLAVCTPIDISLLNIL